MADLSGLNLRRPEPTDWDNYPPGGGERLRPHPAGTYYAKAPALKDIKFESQDGYLRFVNKATIQDPTEGLDDTVYDYVSNKPFQRGKRRGATRMGDFLLAVGSQRRPTENEEWAEAVEEAADAVFPFILDWEAYDKDTDTTVAASYDEFPDDPEHPGSKLPFVEVDRPDGTKKRVAARQRIRFYVFER